MMVFLTSMLISYPSYTLLKYNKHLMTKSAQIRREAKHKKALLITEAPIPLH